ncbi:MAG: ABC transporter permease [Bacillota bacterium]
MSYIDRIKLSLAGVGSNKFRSFLTLLGIIIGVSAVIIMVSLGSGTQQVIGGQFEELVSRQIYLTGNFNLPDRQRGNLTLEDEVYLEESIIGVRDVVPFFRSHLSIKYSGRETRNTVAGVVENVLDITNLKLEHGRSIEQLDIDNHERVAVVGQPILEQLTDSKDYSSFVGREITIDGNKLMIVGVLGVSNSTVGLPNSSVLVPMTTFRNLWRWQGRYANNFLITYDDMSTERDIMTQVEFLMNDKYGTANGKSKFYLQGLQGQVDITNNVIRIFTLVLGGIAAISLLVGGIGVMNIMLVTVKERTREIGVRKAIGASSMDIQSQFLFESIILTIGGGLIGILIGVVMSALINFGIAQFFDWWQGSIPFWVIGLSFGVTAVIGIIFGFYPAYKASKLDPIEALRYE